MFDNAYVCVFIMLEPCTELCSVIQNDSTGIIMYHAYDLSILIAKWQINMSLYRHYLYLCASIACTRNSEST